MVLTNEQKAKVLDKLKEELKIDIELNANAPKRADKKYPLRKIRDQEFKSLLELIGIFEEQVVKGA